MTRAIHCRDVDRIPSIGGWMQGLSGLARIAGISTDEFLADPLRGVVRANKALGVDAMVPPIVPRSLDQVRTAHVSESEHPDVEPEALKQHADSLPDREADILRGFDAGAERQRYRGDIQKWLTALEGIELIPTYWEMSGNFPLYMRFGYEAFLLACAMYPEAVGKIWWADSILSRERAKILVELYREFDLPPVCFAGQDVCNNSGPMVSPQFLRDHYWPHVRRITEVLVNAGIRLVHHCDGDVRPVVADFLASGFSGLQGFQYEVGVDLYPLRQLRAFDGAELYFFAGLSCTRTLPYGREQDVRDEVDYLIDATDGRGMLLFTSNVTGPEVPPENIEAGYRYVKQFDPRQPREARHASWPWALTHPD
ncbi:MAG TPA: hypothetical protein DCX07_10585 [Phycisphaerales bacterium]|nr:hypothetical protein [Phycisphaerales bacterium]